MTLTAHAGIGAYAGNPYYWQYQGKPVLLLGGSTSPEHIQWIDEGMFLHPHLIPELDRLQAAGGNLTRCLMSGEDRENGDWPFARVGDQYDLNQWNESYWQRFDTFLRETHARSICSDIELWATFDYYRAGWNLNPFNPKNNSNYTSEQAGLPDEVNSHPVATKNPFFWTIPEEQNNTLVLDYQQRFVDKILSYTLQYDHVLYCMDNETSVTPHWGAYWARRVQEAAARQGKQVPTTEMWDPWDLNAPMHANTIEHPEIYSYIDISQNNHQSGQTHYDNLMAVRRRIAANPRPLNNIKIYGKDGGLFGTSQDGVERFWRNIFGGAASSRFHEKHLGSSPLALSMIRRAREVTAAFDLFHCAPRPDLLSEHAENGAYCLANPGAEYALYFPSGGNMQLDLRDSPELFSLRWYSIEKGEWADSADLQGSQQIRLTTPGDGSWVAILHRP